MSDGGDRVKRKDKPLGGAIPKAEDVVSATECTGLIPALPQNGAEADEAASLYAVHGAKGSKRPKE